jgi:hypothetical protein
MRAKQMLAEKKKGVQNRGKFRKKGINLRK